MPARDHACLLEAVRLLGRFGAALLDSATVKPHLQALYDQLAVLLELDFFVHYEVAREEGRLVLVVSSEPNGSLGSRLDSLELGQSVCGHVGQDGAPRVVEDVQARQDDATVLIRALDLQAYASYPLKTNGHIIGTLSFGSRRTKALDTAVLSVLDVVSAQIALFVYGKQSGEALRDSEARYRHLVEVTAQAVWEADAAGRPLASSPSWLAYTGQTEAEWLHSRICELAHPDDRTALLSAWEQALAARAPLDCEYRLKHADGSWRWTHLRAAPMLHADGRVARWMGMNVDITARKLSEEALLAADRRKDEFLAILAHELRNPLAPLRTGLDILGSDRIAPEAARSTHVMMRRQLTHIVRLVDDLIDASRLKTGKLHLRRQHVRLDAVLQAAADSIRPAANHKGQRIDMPGELPELVVDGDPVRLTQIFSNILDNAVVHAPAGGAITLRAQGDGAMVAVSVEDEGRGIREEDLPNIFQMFVQSARGQLDKGMGIGLALVHGLVQMHGGTVEAANRKQSSGAVFTVRLPLAAPAMRSVPRPDPSSVGPPSDWVGLRVLVVDDNEDAARSLATLMEMEGHTVRQAATGPQAVQQTNEFCPDVIFMDVGLPGFSGLEATRQIRAAGPRPAPLIAALTGWGQPNDVNESRAAGCDHHLVKPVDYSVVADILAKAKGAPRRANRSADHGGDA